MMEKAFSPCHMICFQEQNTQHSYLQHIISIPLKFAHTVRHQSARFRTILVDLTLSSSSLLLYHISLLPGNFTPRVNLLSHSVAFTMARHTVAGACTREHKRQTVKMRHKLIPHDRANREAYGGRLAVMSFRRSLTRRQSPLFRQFRQGSRQ